MNTQQKPATAAKKPAEAQTMYFGGNGGGGATKKLEKRIASLESALGNDDAVKDAGENARKMKAVIKEQERQGKLLAALTGDVNKLVGALGEKSVAADMLEAEKKAAAKANAEKANT